MHEQHGVGKYVEMMQRTIGGATREYLVIEYAPSKRGHPGDRLYVPTDQLDQVTRYVGGEAPMTLACDILVNAASLDAPALARAMAGYDAAQGYELAGFAWFQGWNDMVDGGTYPNQIGRAHV